MTALNHLLSAADVMAKKEQDLRNLITAAGSKPSSRPESQADGPSELSPVRSRDSTISQEEQIKSMIASDVRSFFMPNIPNIPMTTPAGPGFPLNVASLNERLRNSTGNVSYHTLPAVAHMPSLSVGSMSSASTSSLSSAGGNILPPKLPIHAHSPMQQMPNMSSGQHSNTQRVMQQVAPQRPPVFKCPFVECERKIWLRGFWNETDYLLHMNLHRCQWMLFSEYGDNYTPCRYIPTSYEDALAHLEHHIDHDTLPHVRADLSVKIPGESRRTLYFCPIQCCTSIPYCSKGTPNKAHIHQHIRKHLSQTGAVGH